MERKLRDRVLSTLLIIAMLISYMPQNVFGSEENTPISSNNFSLFINQKMENVSIFDANENKEYADVLAESQDSELVEEPIITHKTTTYSAGEEVQLMIELEENYGIENIFVSNSETHNEQTIEIEYHYDTETGILSFVMPEMNVYINATAVLKEDASNGEQPIDNEDVDDEMIDEDADTDVESIAEDESNIYIRSLSTQLFYGATESQEHGYIWNVGGYEAGHRFSFRVSYSLSGEKVAPANSIQLTIPVSILVDRNGEIGDYYEMSIPTKAEVDAFLNGTGDPIDADVNFGYYEDGENIVIYNYQEIPAGYEGYFEMSYFTTQTTFNYVDMCKSKDFVCHMTTESDEKSTTPINVTINTFANITSTNKRYPVKYTGWQAAWGADIKPENPENYHYLVWTIESNINATQPYNFTLEDTVVGNFEGMELLGYRFSGQATYSTINVVENQTQTRTRYDYVITSIPLENYQDEDYWEANNTIIAYVDPIDQIDEDTNANSSRKWTWTKPTFNLPTGHVNVYKSADASYRGGYGGTHKAPSLDFSSSEYTRYDLETFNGYNGIEITNTTLTGFKYASWIVGYAYPWTYDATYGDVYNPDAYGKLPIKYELIDEGVYLTNETNNSDEFSDMLTSDDFCFDTLGYSWYMSDAVFNEDAQAFAEVPAKYTENDIITFYGKFGHDDAWVQFATYNIFTKTATFDDTYVKSMNGSKIVFQPNVDLIAYKLTTENAHYYTELFTVPSLILKNSQTVMDYVSDKPAIGIRNHNVGNFYQCERETNPVSIVNNEENTGNKARAGATLEPLYNIAIYNVDGNNNPVIGAQFSIYEYDPETNTVDPNGMGAYDTWTTDGTSFNFNCPIASKDEYVAGNWVIIEEVTPDGYETSEPVYVLFDEMFENMTVEEFFELDTSEIEAIYEHDLTVVHNAIEESEDLIPDKLFATASSFNTEFARVSQRYSSLDKAITSVSNNVKNRTYTISWKISQSETMEWGLDGNKSYIPQNGGIFYDLLPDGAVLNKKTIDVSIGTGTFLSNSAYTVTTIENYKNTGRTMLIVNIKVTADYYQVYYDTVHSWNGIADYGKNVYNPVAYETKNETITNGKPDNGGTLQDSDLMSGLTESTEDDTTGSKFLYAEKTWDINALTAATSGLMKKVKAENDSVYSYDATTTLNGVYAYQLRYMNSHSSASKNMILFDSLENYDYDTMMNYGTMSIWRGELQSIDVNQLTSIGIAPVIYYSTISKLDIETNNDITDESVWHVLTDETDLSTVKAIAIDVSKASDGTDFVLAPGQSINVTLYMKAPDICPIVDGGYAYTYNNVYMSNTIFNPTDPDSEVDFLIHQDYTRVKLLITGSFGINKISTESAEIKIEGIEFRLMGTSQYGTTIDSIVKTDMNGQIYFEDIEMGTYILQEYKTTDDWLLDTTEHIVVIDNTGKVWIDESEYTDDYISIANKPRIYGAFNFYKKELGEESIGIVGTKFRLSGTSDYGNDVLMYATSIYGGKTTFENVELGTYQLEEVLPNPNYLLSNIVYTVQVNELGLISIVGSNEVDSEGNPISINDSEWVSLLPNGDTYIYNEYKYTEVELRKVDAENSTIFLEGAIFALIGVSDSGNSISYTANSNKNGIVSFVDIEQGTYILKEIQAPTNLDETGKVGGNLNYILDQTEYIVKVGDKGSVTIEGLEQEANTGYFIVANERMYDKTIVITKIWNDGLTTEERLAAGIIPKLHLTNRDLSQDENFHTHTWDNGIILSNSTCSTNGEKLYTCTECDATNVEKQALLEHTWQLIEEVPSTCKEPGYTKYKCTDCNMPRQDALEILEHSWDEGVVTIEAACETNGEMLYTCTGCATTKTESTEPLGHDFTAADGTCIVCGASNYKYASVVMKDAGSATISVSTSDYDYYNGSLRPYYSKIITFAPTVSGSYTFKATASVDTYGRLYDKDMKSLAYNDDSGGNSQFMITYNCIAGEVYYLAAGRYSTSSSATSIPVTITKTG